MIYTILTWDLMEYINQPGLNGKANLFNSLGPSDAYMRQ